MRKRSLNAIVAPTVVSPGKQTAIAFETYTVASRFLRGWRATEILTAFTAISIAGILGAIAIATATVDDRHTPPWPYLSDPVNTPISLGVSIGLDEVAKIPSDDWRGFSPIQRLSHANDGSARLFIADLRGQIWLLEKGQPQAEPFFDALASFGDHFWADCWQCGIRSFAFHPDFSRPGAPGFGKIYTVTVHSPELSLGDSETPVFKWTQSEVEAVDLVAEWQVDPQYPNRIDPTTMREVVRIEQPRLGHSTEHIAFNPGAKPDDADYGKLYIGVGDGGFDETDPDPFRNGQNTRTPHGSILRIDPTNGFRPGYRVPADNPFVSEPAVLPEIWAYGLRNPQTFSWDIDGDGKLLIADIGHSNIEEINLGRAGANYGWREREGTFWIDEEKPDFLRQIPYGEKARFDYPILQYDHNDVGTPLGTAISGGFVYRGRTIRELIGKYIFADLVSGRLFYASVDELENGTQSPIRELELKNNGHASSMLELVREERADLRLGQDASGEIYLLTKQGGMVWRLVNPALKSEQVSARAHQLEGSRH